MQNKILKAATLIKQADALLVTTGAGMGVDSGLGTFRGRNAGVWPPLEELGIDFSEMSDPVWFDKDPAFGWGFWNFRYTAYTGATPHKGYHLLRDWGKNKALGSFFFTSNIDSHWTRVGIPDSQLREVHGTVSWMQCVKPCCNEIWETPKLDLKMDEKGHKVVSELPTCPHCSKLGRPAVLMFGDWSHVYNKREKQQDADYAAWSQSISAKDAKLVIVEVGAGTAVPTVRYESQSMAEEHGAPLIRINMDQSEIPRSTLEASPDSMSIAMGGLEALQAIQDALDSLG